MRATWWPSSFRSVFTFGWMRVCVCVCVRAVAEKVVGNTYESIDSFFFSFSVVVALKTKVVAEYATERV